MLSQKMQPRTTIEVDSIAPLDASVAGFEEPQPEIISLQDALQAGVTDLEKLPITPTEGTEIVEFISLGHSNQNEHFDVFDGDFDLEDLIQAITLLQCRFCQYNCGNKNLLITHIKAYHKEEVRDLVKQGKLVGASTSPQELKKLVRSPTPTFTEAPSRVTASTDFGGSGNILGISDGNEISQKEPQAQDGSENNEHGKGETTIYLCSFCNCTFEQFGQCENHMKTEHYQLASDLKTIASDAEVGFFNAASDNIDPLFTPNATAYCRSDSRDSRNLTVDVLEQQTPRRLDTDNSRSFRCPQRFCPQRFRTEEALNYHKQSHLLRIILSDREKDKEEESLRSNDKACNTELPPGINQLYKCPECGVRIFSWRNTVSHLWKKHQVDCDQYSCKLCDYKTPSYYKLLTHNQIHSDRRNYVCVTCGKDYKQLAQLRNHMIVHKDKKSGEIKNSWYTPKVCDFCQRTFSSGRCLKKHIETVHMKLKNFECATCGHQAARKSMLMIHMRLHTGEKPYVCDYEGCSYRTCDHNSLRRHKMQHSGEKPYKCSYCPYACIQSISYKRHIRTKHPEVGGSDVFECHRCSFRTINEDKMTGHIATHEEQDRIERREQPPGISLPKVTGVSSEVDETSQAVRSVTETDFATSLKTTSNSVSANMAPLGTFVVIPYDQESANRKSHPSVRVNDIFRIA